MGDRNRFLQKDTLEKVRSLQQKQKFSIQEVQKKAEHKGLREEEAEIKISAINSKERQKNRGVIKNNRNEEKGNT